ncbi:hypothetical protein ACFFUE_06575 [Bergeyella porcorum]|uniref:hypothetical protein n=1 Tax=Bergeyella porcorum TaxID=1735111 RepID=UPI0035EF13B0
MKKLVFSVILGLVSVSMSANSVIDEKCTKSTQEGGKKLKVSLAIDELPIKDVMKVRCYTEGPDGRPVEIKCPEPGGTIPIIVIDDGTGEV